MDTVNTHTHTHAHTHTHTHTHNISWGLDVWFLRHATGQIYRIYRTYIYRQTYGYAGV